MFFLPDFILKQCGYHLVSAIDDNPLAVLSKSIGVRPKDVQELLGYSDVSTTINVYAHVTGEAERDSAKLPDKVVGMN